MRERQANFKQPEDVSQPGAAETPAPLAGRIDPPWGGQASGFVQAEVGSSRRVGGCANPPCSNQNTPAPFLAVSADTRASAAERVCRWGAVAGACVCVLCARARVCVCVCVCVCVGSVAASAAADGKALSTHKSKKGTLSPLSIFSLKKNTKSIFFSEKLITWKTGRLGLMSG